MLHIDPEAAPRVSVGKRWIVSRSWTAVRLGTSRSKYVETWLENQSAVATGVLQKPAQPLVNDHCSSPVGPSPPLASSASESGRSLAIPARPARLWLIWLFRAEFREPVRMNLPGSRQQSSDDNDNFDFRCASPRRRQKDHVHGIDSCACCAGGGARRMNRLRPGFGGADFGHNIQALGEEFSLKNKRIVTREEFPRKLPDGIEVLPWQVYLGRFSEPVRPVPVRPHRFHQNERPGVIFCPIRQ